MPRQHPKAPLPAAGSASCTPRAGPAGGTRDPACEGPVCQSSEPDCRPGGQQRCWGALSPPPLPEHRREGTHVALPWTQAGVGTQVALPWTQAGVGTQVALPWTQAGVGTQVALPWTQAEGGNPGGPALDTGWVWGDGSRRALSRLSGHRRVSWKSHCRFMNQGSMHACVLKTWEDGHWEHRFPAPSGSSPPPEALCCQPPSKEPLLWHLT